MSNVRPWITPCTCSQRKTAYLWVPFGCGWPLCLKFEELGGLEVCYCWWKNSCTIQYEESSCLLKVSFCLHWCRISSSNRTIWYHRVQPDMYSCILWIVSIQIFGLAFMLWQPSSHRKQILRVKTPSDHFITFNLYLWISTSVIYLNERK